MLSTELDRKLIVTTAALLTDSKCVSPTSTGFKLHCLESLPKFQVQTLEQWLNLLGSTLKNVEHNLTHIRHQGLIESDLVVLGAVLDAMSELVTSPFVEVTSYYFYSFELWQRFTPHSNLKNLQPLLKLLPNFILPEPSTIKIDFSSRRVLQGSFFGTKPARLITAVEFGSRSSINILQPLKWTRILNFGERMYLCSPAGIVGKVEFPARTVYFRNDLTELLVSILQERAHHLKAIGNVPPNKVSFLTNQNNFFLDWYGNTELQVPSFKERDFNWFEKVQIQALKERDDPICLRMLGAEINDFEANCKLHLQS